MNPKKILALLAMIAAAFATPCFAQIFWSNQSPAGITDDIWCVTYANGTFAAVTGQGKVLTSNNGLVWGSQTVAEGTWLVSVTYGNGTWVVVGAGGTILVSSDLQTWVNAKSATTNKLNGVLFNGTMFLAVGDSATVVTSPDAINWTVQTIPASWGITGFLHGITLVPDNQTGTNTAFLVSGAVSGNGMGSVDAGVLFEVSPDGTSFSQVYTSGVTPTAGGVPAGNLEAVLYEPNLPTVAVGWLGSAIDSPNGDISYPERAGETWADTPTVLPDIVFRGLAYGNGYLVAAGEQGSIFTSSDGMNWKQRFSGDSPSTLSTSVFLSAAYSETLQRFVVTGTGGTILVSNPAPTVFGNVSTRGYVSSTQTFIGGFVIEGTAPRTVLIRGDGPVLSAFGVPSPLPDPVLTVYNSSGTVIATNTGWATNANPKTISTSALEVGAFALPNLSPDSALLLTLQPGAYTAQITSAKGNSGIALFEAYTD
ncbi:MAG TPA: hypothetical protein VN775_09150 [Opitutaceae bacterium]|nr:hypothetical protein [Opitutaceae bacterium]